MFKLGEQLSSDQIKSLENIAREGIDAIAAVLRESYDARVRAIYIERLINQADADGDTGAVRTEVKRLLHKEDSSDAIQNK